VLAEIDTPDLDQQSCKRAPISASPGQCQARAIGAERWQALAGTDASPSKT